MFLFCSFVVVSVTAATAAILNLQPEVSGREQKRESRHLWCSLYALFFSDDVLFYLFICDIVRWLHEWRLLVIWILLKYFIGKRWKINQRKESRKNIPYLEKQKKGEKMGERTIKRQCVCVCIYIYIMCVCVCISMKRQCVYVHLSMYSVHVCAYASLCGFFRMFFMCWGIYAYSLNLDRLRSIFLGKGINPIILPLEVNSRVDWALKLWYGNQSRRKKTLNSNLLNSA